ncbi:hypothetical protein GGF41_003761 [Coemansia sp. RSA 2531]|nr:hypothetical protein GGF41_003761 [Coemansia sp. RSA 2531]
MSEVHSVSLSFFDVLSVLKALPALVNIRSGIGGLGRELGNIAAEDILDHIATTYCNAGMNLRIWYIAFLGRQYRSEMIDYILLLALVSPKIRWIQLLPHSIQDSRVKLADALNSPLYSKHALQLNKVLDIV